MKRLLIMMCVAFLGIGVTWGQYYEPVIKPTMDSISWKAWSRNTEEDVVSNKLYVKRNASSISLLYENGGQAQAIGQLQEDNGQLWITYTICNIIEDVCNNYEVLLMDMSLSIGDEFVLPTGITTQVSDVLYQEGRKVIVFASTINYSEWGEPLMFIEGVGPNFLSLDGPYEIFGTIISCKFEDESLVYAAQNSLFDECELISENVKEQKNNKENVIIYPNPVDEVLYFLSDDVICVELYDIQGNTIANEDFTCNHINLHGLPKSEYIIRFRMATGHTVEKKIIKR